MTIAQHLQQVNQQIQQCCIKAGRNPTDVSLLAVSKTKPIDDILTAHQLGQRAFGENYVQEGVDKIEYCRQQGIELEWHFIGSLQSNKTRLVAEYFDWYQTLSRAKIADRLNEQRSPYRQPLNVLIQINISHEDSKSGIEPQDMLSLAQHLTTLPNLRLRGLMAIPEATEDTQQQLIVFEKMQTLFHRLQQTFPTQPIDTLSLGMSGDMESAIRCGSTMVRIGTAIFGQR
ncbi:YggS family pyridoxal phosphate-dependent enzyme [Conservatibacter flavescens]|uniref:Pyridoxal phosphate homeostasis protein n=1 Tax=Conservatibacter flavescens TaxID=28161 RepID=A0A2M8S0I1_9PAST|nr:YggS family pyridoxal phosphate-dependent enzyme [Conservatibacter flavescens]PJG84628.1 YggS family pyridoxal phosphate-dependent enzyme [Conservatibacter flavescens]